MKWDQLLDSQRDYVLDVIDSDAKGCKRKLTTATHESERTALRGRLAALQAAFELLEGNGK